MKIALVVLNWNGKALLEQFLPSIIKNSPQADIYVADNASTDNSVAFLKKEFPDVTIIANKKNYGFAKGYNVALKKINSEVFCLINSDVETSKNWLVPIIEHYSQNKSASIIQPKILDYNNKNKFEYAGAAGGFLDKYGYAYCRGRIFEHLEKDNNQYKNSKITWASGACFFIKKEDFTSLNGFDEDYFAHYEEIDLCWRAFNKNLSINYIADSTVYHVGGGTLNNSNPFKTFLNFRNSLFTLVKNLPQQKLIPIIFTRMVLDGLAGIRFLLQGQPKHLWSILKAHFSFYTHLKKMYLKRDLHQKPNYYHKKSIVWDYFVLNQKTHN